MTNLPLPCDLMAERMILGSVILNDSAFTAVECSLSSEDFSTEVHRRIFAGMKALAAKGSPIDRVTLASYFSTAGQLESIGGYSYLASIDEGLPVITNLDAYVSTVHDKSILRRAIFYHQKSIEECFLQQESPTELLQRAERSLSDLAVQGRPQSDLNSVLEAVLQSGGPMVFTQPDGNRIGIKTPWPRLNEKLESGGMLPGQMITIGARPSLGKTSLLCQIAIKAAMEDHATAFFSLEMSTRAIITRLACTVAQVDSMLHSQGRSNLFERGAISDALVQLTDHSKLWISSKCYTLPSMRRELLKLSAKEPLRLIGIDYLQLMEPTGSAGRNRTEQISELSRGVKRLAEEFKATVVVLSQLNRDMDRENRAPRLSDLRDGGSVEQDSDVVLLPHRLPDQPDHLDEVSVDLIIAKQRNGALGRVPLTFRRRFTKFMERL